jgi:hypothetical protein
MPDKFPTRPVTIIVEWIDGSESDRDRFMSSLGLKEDQWREPQVAQIGDQTTMCFFGMGFKSDPVFADFAEWHCRFERMPGVYSALYINETMVAATLATAESVERMPVSLQAIYVEDSQVVSLPPRFSELKNLTEVAFVFCYSLTNLSELSGLINIKELSIWGCPSLTDVGALAGLRNLKRLDIWRCGSLTGASVVASLTELNNVELCNCSERIS